MATDLKTLGKMVYELEKRLKFNEAKIKVLADSMTESKDIEKYLDVLYKKIGREMAENDKVTRKLLDRQDEMADRAHETREKEREKRWDKESKIQQKEFEKSSKDNVRKADMAVIQARLTALETQVQAALKR